MPASHPAIGKTARARRPLSSKAHVGWAVRARTTVLDSERYTRFVAIMKRALLLAAVALLIAVLAYSLQPRDINKYAMTFERMGTIANDLAMEKPHLSGSDGDGNPFVVTADMAIQDVHHTHRATLARVQADLSEKSGAWYTLSAPHGVLDTDAQKLSLNQNVSLYSDSGYELHTQAAFIDLAQACDPVTGKPPPPRGGKPAMRCARTTVRGDHTVTGHGPMGNVRADRFRIEKATKHLIMDGHVAMRIYPAQATESPERPKRQEKS